MKIKISQTTCFLVVKAFPCYNYFDDMAVRNLLVMYSLNGGKVVVSERWKVDKIPMDQDDKAKGPNTSLKIRKVCNLWKDDVFPP